MRKPVSSFPLTRGTSNRFGQSRLGGGVSASNSNTRIVVPRTPAAPPATNSPTAKVNLGLNSDRSRATMVARLRDQGITNEQVLAAMGAVPRHLFVDEGLASRAYEDAALPIGHGQTISQPWIVARMISAVCEDQLPVKVLEVGAGCGYQAAVLAQIIKEVHAIERIRGLYELARNHLRELKLLPQIRLRHADGMQGLPEAAPFDAIIVAAAGIKIPQALLEQLAIGGRLIAPEGSTAQRLIFIQRVGINNWRRDELESVRFVPLRAGIQS